MARVIRAQRRGRQLIAGEVWDARAQAAVIVETAKQDAAALRERAIAEGHELGRAQAAQQLVAIARARAKAVSDVEHSALQAALMVAGRIVGEALDDKAERVTELLLPLLARIRRARCIVVRAHPSDVDTLQRALAELITRADLQGTLEIVADAEITRGGCLIESSAGDLDARIETRIAELARLLGVEPPP